MNLIIPAFRIATFWVATMFFCFVAASSRAETPNIILLMSDDQGWGDVGFNGNERIKTPHLDEMAASGIRFDRFYASASLCSPTRGACLTGRYPFRFGVLAAHTGGMRVGEITIAEILKSKDYATGFFGKWHIGWVKMEDAGSRGFFSPPSLHGYDEFFATTSAVPTWDPGVTPEGWNRFGQKEGEPWKGGMPYVHDGIEVTENITGDDSRVIMDRVIPFIDKNKESPFFATVWFHTPHEPVVAGQKYKDLYPKAGELRKNYYGSITAMDEQIGRLRTKLRELSLEKNTLLIFCSDNGPSDSLAKKDVASTGGFRGHKHTMYDGGLLVPACAEWPGRIPEGGQSGVRCSTVDFLPTVASLVGYEFTGSKKRPIDGIDLMPVIDGEQESRNKDLFFGYRRLVRGVDGQALIRGNYKLLREAKEGGRTRLFDLANDPYEKNDLSKIQEFSELRKELEKAMAEIDKSCQISRDGGDYHY